MITEETYTTIPFSVKLKELVVLTKLRLSFLVVLSALSGYLLAGGSDGYTLLLLCTGGFLVTGSSNAWNQIIERDIDKLMKRTQNRPLPQGKLSVLEAAVAAALFGLSGLFLLWMINPLSALLGFFALFLYVAIYTPSKRVTPWAVFIGAFPGAIPPMLGWVAHSGTFGLEPGILFFVQFVWQFPHFWAIAWVMYDDYLKAGYKLLPSKYGKTKSSAFLMLFYSGAVIPASLIPWALEMTGTVALVVCLLSGLAFFFYALKFYRTMDDKDARKLMFASFIYLPIMQFIYLVSF